MGAKVKEAGSDVKTFRTEGSGRPKQNKNKNKHIPQKEAPMHKLQVLQPNPDRSATGTYISRRKLRLR